MNAFHEQMEKILLGQYDGFNARGVANMRDDAAVLAYLIEDIAANPPADKDATYETAFALVRRSVEDLREAIRSGDMPAIKAALKTLKPPLRPHVPELWIGTRLLFVHSRLQN